MIFSAYLGVKDGASGWLRALRDHAEWLGLECRIFSEALPTDAVFTYAWLQQKSALPSPPIDRSPENVRFRTSVVASSENAASIELALPEGELQVVVPLTTPEHVYSASRAGAQVVGNDLRLMIRWTGLDLDPRGVFSILRFNASPAPFTVSRRVLRIPPGHAARLSLRNQEPVYSAACGDVIDAPDLRVLPCIDETLSAVPRNAVLFFSGGVDSALLASRLSKHGRTDVRLLNLAFEAGDPESEHARLVASHLGLAFDRVAQTDRGVTRLLERLGRDYSFPFGDPSTIPTHVLALSALDGGAPPAVIEGTGADGAFGVGLKLARWSPLYSLPRAVRSLLGSAYSRAELWKSAGRVSRASRLARRSADLPLHIAAILARNALDGIAYAVPIPVRDEIDAAVDRFAYALSEGADPRERLSLLDLVTVCAERFATKSYDPLRFGGTPAIYPFLEPAMVRLSASLTWEQKCGNGEKKKLLKDLLARSLPPAMVYRRKAGFDPPLARTFSSRPIREYLNDVVIAPDSPLREFLNRKAVVEMVARAGGGAPLDAETYEFLWTLCATAGWLASMRNAVAAAP